MFFHDTNEGSHSVYVSSLFLDRFGRRTNLRLEHLSDGLNVIFGPPGSGKTTLVDFLRAMWNGFDPGLRDRYLPPESRGFGGVLVVQTPQGRQVVSRYDDGGSDGRLTVEREDGSVIGRRNVHDLFGDVSSRLLQCAFLVDFQRLPRLEELFEAAAANDIWRDRSAAKSRLVELERTLAQKRDALALLPVMRDSLETLRQRRRELLQQSDSLTAKSSRITEEQLLRRQRLVQGIAELEQQERAVRAELDSLERKWIDLDDRRRRMASPPQTRQVTSDLASQRRTLEVQLTRWKRTLREVVARKQRAAERSDDRQLGMVATAAAAASPRQRLTTLESRIRELQQSLEQLAAGNRGISSDELRTASVGPLQAMRDDIYQLCNDLNDWQTHHHHRQALQERDQHARCEQELRQSIRSLMEQRHSLLRRIAAANSTVAVRPEHETFCQCDDHPQPVSTNATEVILENGHPQELVDRDAESVRVDAARRHCRAKLNDVLAELLEARNELSRLDGPSSFGSEIDALQAALKSNEQAIRDAERRLPLTQEIKSVEEECRKLREESQSSHLLREAAEYLRRLSSSDWVDIHATSPNDVWVQNPQGRRVRYSELDAGGRDQVYLAFCMALTAALDRDGVQLPLVLNAAFANYPSKHVRDAIEMLRDFARGRQVLCLTRHEHVASVARILNLPVHSLESSAAPVSRPYEPIAAREPRPVSRLPEDRLLHVAQYDARAELWDAEESPGQSNDRVRRRDASTYRHDPASTVDRPSLIRSVAIPEPVLPAPPMAVPVVSPPAAPVAKAAGSETEFCLYEHDPIDRSPSVDDTNADRLRSIGILRVGDLLRASPSDVGAELRSVGVSIEMVQAWQSQANLMCRVRGLHPYDARILVACGITDPDHLLRMSASALRARVKEFSSSAEGQAILLSGTESELSRVTDWIRPAIDPLNQELSLAERENRSGHEPRKKEGRSRQRGGGSANRAESEGRSGSRDSRGEGAQRREPDSIAVVPIHGGDQLRFYLQRSSPVVDAPSIGASLAKRLERIGVVSVADLLATDAAAISSRLQMNRITAETVLRWQQQTELVCRVPQLRGHDAQILVAVGVTSAELLESQNVADLSRRVQSFCESVEGKRVVRNGNSPSAEEVAEWIQWSRRARTMNAA